MEKLQRAEERARRIWPGVILEVFEVTIGDHLLDQLGGYAIGWWVRALAGTKTCIIGKAYVGLKLEEQELGDAAKRAARSGITKCPKRYAEGALPTEFV